MLRNGASSYLETKCKKSCGRLLILVGVDAAQCDHILLLAISEPELYHTSCLGRPSGVASFLPRLCCPEGVLLCIVLCFPATFYRYFFLKISTLRKFTLDTTVSKQCLFQNKFEIFTYTGVEWCRKHDFAFTFSLYQTVFQWLYLEILEIANFRCPTFYYTGQKNSLYGKKKSKIQHILEWNYVLNMILSSEFPQTT